MAAMISAAAVHAQATVRIDLARSAISYTGSAPLHDWTGTSRSVSGEVTFSTVDPSGASVRISAPVTSFDSGNATRDRKMHSLTDADTHPRVVFEARAVEVTSWNGEQGRWRLRGSLTFAGRRGTVESEAAVRWRGGRLTAEGAFSISLTAYHVERPSIVGFPIGDEIEIEYDLLLR